MHTSQTLEAADGTSIWYGTIGKGPAIVLCDGFACDGFIWPYVIDHFCEDFTIVRWHYRGHGRSGIPDDLSQLSLEVMCDDLERVLDALGLEKAIFMGHSMGVQVILQAYEQFGERMSALVPICGTYKYPLETFNDSDVLARMLPYIDRFTAMAPKAVQAVWEKALPSQLSYLIAHLTELNHKLVRGEDFKPYLQHTGAMDVRVYVGMLKHLAEHSAEMILPKITIPTLIVASEFDSFTPMHRSQKMQELIRDSELLVLPGGSHAGPIELPDTVNGAIEKFLRKNRLYPRAARQRPKPAQAVEAPAAQ